LNEPLATKRQNLQKSTSGIFKLEAEELKGRKILRNASYSELPLGDNSNYKPPGKNKYNINHFP
jgi:hypothetical protein